MRYVLLTGRTLKQGISLEAGKTSKEYFEDVAVIMMNEDDMKEIKVEEGKPVKVSTGLGSVVVKCRKAKLDRGIVFMPFGPWASLLIGIDTQGTGMPDSKGIEAEVTATDEDAQTIADILKMVRGAR
jgi:formylmethanofuran dehydrogenase subunit D